MVKNTKILNKKSCQKVEAQRQKKKKSKRKIKNDFSAKEIKWWGLASKTMIDERYKLPLPKKEIIP